MEGIQVKSGFPVHGIHAVSRLEESVFFVYIELIAREKTTYMQASGRLSGDIVDMNEFSDDE